MKFQFGIQRSRVDSHMSEKNKLRIKESNWNLRRKATENWEINKLKRPEINYPIFSNTLVTQR